MTRSRVGLGAAGPAAAIRISARGQGRGTARLPAWPEPGRDAAKGPPLFPPEAATRLAVQGNCPGLHNSPERPPVDILVGLTGNKNASFARCGFFRPYVFTVMF